MESIKKRETKKTRANKVPFYELEIVRFLIKDGTGLDIAYAFEDLVFAEHGIFILQFVGESSQSFDIWFNKDCNVSDRLQIFESIMKSATLNGFEINYKGKFEMYQKLKSEEISINFIKM